MGTRHTLAIGKLRKPAMYDAIIIGAGMSGLAAGIRLAYYGKQVCILERHTTIGGLNSFYRIAGRNFDVGLHAITNFTPKGTRWGPLAKLLRQLRFAWDEFSLSPQLGSTIAFGDVRLRFNNNFELLRSEVERNFPREKDNFCRLVASISDYDQLEKVIGIPSARKAVCEIIKDPLLVEMLLCPLMFYGSAREEDMDFAQFCIMFRSIYLEGLARPLPGVRLILKHLVRKFKHLGGELRLQAGVSGLVSDQDEIRQVVLGDGSQLAARQVLSSAGWVETMRLCGAPPPVSRPAGQLSFVESVAVLDQQPLDLGCDQTIVFFNDSPTFGWRKPNELIDVHSGVICSPNNFAYPEPLGEGVIRITALANFDRWRSLEPDAYRDAKAQAYEQMAASAVRFIPDYRPHVIATDTFTPTTIRRYTGHDNGAVYGAPNKQWDGVTHLKNLFVCGTDQGFVGIIGAIISGISMANRHLLKDPG